jgi:hypothetical protein
LLGLVLGTDNPSTVVNEFSKLSPLVTGLKKLINMFECQENPDILESLGYVPYLVYPLAKVSERRSVESIRKHMATKKIDPVQQFSTMFMTPPPGGDEETYSGEDKIYNHMPLPDLEKTDSYCVFALRKEEVERVLRGPPELDEAAFTAELDRIEKEEEAKYGPLPDVPARPLAIMPPPAQLALPAPEVAPAPAAPPKGKRLPTTPVEAPAPSKPEAPAKKVRKHADVPPPVAEPAISDEIDI